MIILPLLLTTSGNYLVLILFIRLVLGNRVANQVVVHIHFNRNRHIHLQGWVKAANIGRLPFHRVVFDLVLGLVLHNDQILLWIVLDSGADGSHTIL